MSVERLESINHIKAADWDAIANPNPARHNPFISHAFLSALENSGSATAHTGWEAQHILVRAGDKITALAPCYRKTHSMGEYVFDQAWAQAFARAGGAYYPKLQICVPFSPVIAPKLLGKNFPVEKLIEVCAATESSGIHATFTSPQDHEILRRADWLERNDIQFHWYNAGYQNFDEFLSALSSSKRKNIRKERAAVFANGVTFKQLSGDDLRSEHWDAFWHFYQDTGARKWGQPYLTRSFFDILHETMREQVLLIMAYRDGRPIAGALNMIGGDTLFGRNWGCVLDLPFLHFETCYYQAIDWAIARGFKTIEAGAQGDHKLARGYIPVKTSSFHYLAHPSLHRAVADYLVHERQAITQGQAELATHAPFRQVDHE